MIRPYREVGDTALDEIARKLGELEREVQELRNFKNLSLSGRQVENYIENKTRHLVHSITGSGNPTTLDAQLNGEYNAYEIFARTRCTGAFTFRNLEAAPVNGGTLSSFDGIFYVISTLGQPVTQVTNNWIRVGSSTGADAQLSTWYGYCRITLDLRGNRPNIESNGGYIRSTADGHAAMTHTWASSRTYPDAIRFRNGSDSPFESGTVIDTYGIPN